MLLMAVALIIPGLSRADTAELEPNNSCVSPQMLSTDGVQVLAAERPVGDVDYYRMDLTPGSSISFTVHDGTMDDAWVGIFTSSCSLVTTFSAASGANTQGTFFLSPTGDGTVILAVDGCCTNGAFNGSSSLDSGTYTLEITPTIKQTYTLSGKIKQPVGGLYTGNGTLQINRCTSTDDTSCADYVMQAFPSEGKYSVDSTDWGAGYYRLRFSPSTLDGFSTTTGSIFYYDGASDAKQNLILNSNALVVSDLRTCADEAVDGVQPGQKCKVYITVQSMSNEVLDADLWLIVERSASEDDPNHPVQFGRMDAEPVQLSFEPGTPTQVRLTFSVPAQAETGDYIGISVYGSKPGIPTTMYLSNAQASFWVGGSGGMVPLLSTMPEGMKATAREIERQRAQARAETAGAP